MGFRENIRNKVKVCSKEDIIVGARFGKLLITGFSRDKYNRPTILYKCGCGKIGTTYSFNITHGKQSCGCDQYSNNSKRAYKHGMAGTWGGGRASKGGGRFYSCYYNIKNRTNDNHKYTKKDRCYEGKKCLRNSFEDFKKDMYESYIEHCEKYGEDNTTIDRIDYNGDYCKENCRWATISEQAYNKKQSIRISLGGKNYCAKELYDIKKPQISYSTFIRRIKKGYSIEDAMLPKDEFKNKEKI